jgi:hypothetical protein
MSSSPLLFLHGLGPDQPLDLIPAAVQREVQRRSAWRFATQRTPPGMLDY